MLQLKTKNRRSRPELAEGSILKTNKGFTLLELMLVIAVIAIITLAVTPTILSYLSKNDVDTARISVVEALRRAENLSSTTNLDSTWGVYLQNGSVTIYKGATYSGRDTSADEIIDIGGNITFGGLNEVNFSKMLAEPNTIGTVNITGNNNETANVTINAKGMVDY